MRSKNRLKWGLNTVLVMAIALNGVSPIAVIASETSSVSDTVDDVTGVVDDVTGAVDDIQGTIDGILSGLLAPVQDFMGQIEDLRDGILDRVEELISGKLDDLLGGLEGGIEDLLGELNLPDPTAIAEAIEEAEKQQEESGMNATHQINPVLYRRGTAASFNVETARIDAMSVLDAQAQEATATQLQELQNQVTQAVELASGTAELSQQSSEMSQESGTISQQSSAQAQTAQTRVSTQDALKDLNLIAAMQSSQLASLSTQESAQSGQLSNISSQMAAQLQIDSAQLLRMNQMVTGMAVANQNLADLNEQAQGEERSRIIEGNSMSNRVNTINSLGYRFFR